MTNTDATTSMEDEEFNMSTTRGNQNKGRWKWLCCASGGPSRVIQVDPDDSLDSSHRRSRRSDVSLVILEAATKSQPSSNSKSIKSNSSSSSSSSKSSAGRGRLTSKKASGQHEEEEEEVEGEGSAEATIHMEDSSSTESLSTLVETKSNDAASTATSASTVTITTASTSTTIASCHKAFAASNRSSSAPVWSLKQRVDCPNKRGRKSLQHQQRSPSSLSEQDELDLSREQKMVMEAFSTSQHGIDTQARISRPSISIQEASDSETEREDILDKSSSKDSVALWTTEAAANPVSPAPSPPTSPTITADHYHQAPPPPPPLKGVQFSTVTIREYPITVGDNPSTTRGVPLTIEWEHAREYTLQVADFEFVRPSIRRNMGELQTESLDRIRILKSSGWSGGDLKRHAQQVNVARLQRQQTRTRIQSAPRLAKVEEGWERMVRCIRNGTTRRRYKQWERQWLAQYTN